MGSYFGKACANIALLKYFAKTDDALKLPAMRSIGLCMSGLTTRILLRDDGLARRIEINGGTAAGVDIGWAQRIESGKREVIPGAATQRIDQYLRQFNHERASLYIESTVPRGVGLASSAAFFAALAGAVGASQGIENDQIALARLARLGSGSATRSVPGGCVQWLPGNDLTSVGLPLFKSSYWPALRILPVVIDQAEKLVGSTEGMARVKDSTALADWVACNVERFDKMLLAFQNQDFGSLAVLVEQDAESLHAVCEQQGIIYRTELTRRVCGRVQALRRDGFNAMWTLDAGPNPVLIVDETALKPVQEALAILGVSSLQPSEVGTGLECGAYSD